MRYFLENDFLKVEVESFGAEVKSVMNKQNNQEYMWYGNPKYWGRTSPVLFPIVGSLQEKQYQYQGQSYSMGQHGFARDMEHTLVEQSADYLLFELASDENTLAKYPFQFRLCVGYRLLDTELQVIWTVHNPANEEMYFSIGAHPAFLCPVHGEKSKQGYKICFDGLDEVHYHGITSDTGLSLQEDLVLPLTQHRVTLTQDFFDRCALIVEGSQTNQVSLEDAAGEPIVTLRFDTPLFALWSPEGKNAPFICIEPWYGRCDAVDFHGELQDREYGNRLPALETFKAQYSIYFHV